MGEFMRQYWLPAALSSEVKADGDPLRLLILGEKLVAFRDSEGRVGILDHRCPHRCASLFLGRNEEGGIRCVYHGWKFDVKGACLDMPNMPEHRDFKARVHAKAYRTAERNGLVWVYMGAEQASPPLLPHIEANLIADSDIWCLQRECNWLQALEGDIDTSHVGFLHVGSLRPEDLPEDHPMRPTVLNRTPEYEVRSTEWGAMYGGYRDNDDGQKSWRIAHFMYPFWTQTPNTRFASRAIARAWVPMDDNHSMLFDISGGADEGNPAYISTRKTGEPLFEKFHYAPRTTDWYGRWKCRDGEHNDWGINRESQRNGVQFTGIANITIQDQAVTESMGPIIDHSAEHLAPSDQMIARTRRLLLAAARAWRDGKEIPPGARIPEVYLGARSGSFLAGPGTTLEDAYTAQLQKAQRWV
ncbi:MAG: Rieske 2Fe-2S domain-containing protein [Proteobacteria bacterium]|nr:Rieske 2Fe-2S domain-containing protein [Pseudomonadota bacterium]